MSHRKVPPTRLSFYLYCYCQHPWQTCSSAELAQRKGIPINNTADNGCLGEARRVRWVNPSDRYCRLINKQALCCRGIRSDTVLCCSVQYLQYMFFNRRPRCPGSAQVWFQNARAKFRRNLLRQESGGGDKTSDGSVLAGGTPSGPVSEISNGSMSPPSSTPTTLTDLSNPTMPTVTSVLSGGPMDVHECRSPSQTTLTSLF